MKRQQPLRKHVRKNLWSPLYHFSQAVSPVLQVVPVQPLSCRLHQLLMAIWLLQALHPFSSTHYLFIGVFSLHTPHFLCHSLSQHQFPSSLFSSLEISVCVQGVMERYTKPADAPYNLCNRHEERCKTVSCSLIRPWRIILKNCPIMLCSNALNCFDYASK